MSKFRINDRVVVKKTNANGIIKGREVKDIGNGKVEVEYVVKTGDGFENWGAYSKEQLVKITNSKEATPIPTLVLDAANGYKVTLVAILTNHKIYDVYIDEDDNIIPYARKGKDLRIGYAIYNPNDEYDYKLGQRIATHRANNAPFCHLISDFNGEFNKESVDALLKVKGDYIVKNIDHFIDRKK